MNKLLLLVLLPFSLNAQTTLLTEDFESGSLPSGWLTDGSPANYWTVLGTSAINGSFSAMITNTGESWGYNPNTNSEASLRAPIFIPSGEPVLKVSLTWKGRGEPSWDDLKLLIDTGTGGSGGGGESVLSRTSPEFINYKWISGNETARRWTFYYNTLISDTAVFLNFRWNNDDCCYFGDTEELDPQPIMIDDIRVESLPLNPMNGSYTVGTGGDFSSLDEAWSALYTLKVSGDVTLNLLNYSYDDPVRIYGSFQPENGTYTVTVKKAEPVSGTEFKMTSHYFYQGEPGDLVPVIYIEETDHLVLDGISVYYQTGAPGGIQIVNSRDITIRNSVFEGPSEFYSNRWEYSSGIRIWASPGFFSSVSGPSVSASDSRSARSAPSSLFSGNRQKTNSLAPVSGIRIEGNLFNNGNAGIYVASNQIVPAQFEVEGLSIHQNYLFNSRLVAIHTENADSVSIKENLIHQSLDYLPQAAVGLSVHGISESAAPTRSWGSTFSRETLKADRARKKHPGSAENQLTRQEFKSMWEKRQLHRFPALPAYSKNQVINNILYTSVTESPQFSSSLFIRNMSELDIYHNSLVHQHSGSVMPALALTGTNAVLSVKNNIIDGGNGISLYSEGAIENSDYNLFWSVFDTLASVAGTNYLNFGDFQTGTGTNGASHFKHTGFNDYFLVPDEVHEGDPDFAGTPLGIETDFDGTSRSSEAPTIGAQEISGTVPVELSSFSVSRTGSGLLLTWETRTETGNYGWDIQKSAGYATEKSQWETIGFVAGKGTVSTPSRYSFTAGPSAGTVSFRLRQQDLDGRESFSRIAVAEAVPVRFELSGNYPNPFNPETTIRFSLPGPGDVTLAVYSVTGQLIHKTELNKLDAGVQSVSFKGDGLASGVYLYRVTFSGKTLNGKMSLIR